MRWIADTTNSWGRNPLHIVWLREPVPVPFSWKNRAWSVLENRAKCEGHAYQSQKWGKEQECGGICFHLLGRNSWKNYVQ